jgi:hypothetical protein
VVPPAISIRPLRDTAQRYANSSFEGMAMRPFWPIRRISPPLSDFAQFRTIGPSSALPIQGQTGLNREPHPHTSPRSPLTQKRCLPTPETRPAPNLRGVLCAGHCDPGKTPAPSTRRSRARVVRPQGSSPLSYCHAVVGRPGSREVEQRSLTDDRAPSATRSQRCFDPDLVIHAIHRCRKAPILERGVYNMSPNGG